MVLTEVTTLDDIIRLQLSSAMTAKEVNDMFTGPQRDKYKLRSGDIPNVKLSGDYNKEMGRAAQYYAWYLTTFLPNLTDRWIAEVEAGNTLGRALLNALGVSSRSELKPFPSEYVQSVLKGIAGIQPMPAGGAGGSQPLPQVATAVVSIVVGIIIILIVLGTMFKR